MYFEKRHGREINCFEDQDDELDELAATPDVLSELLVNLWLQAGA